MYLSSAVDNIIKLVSKVLRADKGKLYRRLYILNTFLKNTKLLYLYSKVSPNSRSQLKYQLEAD